LAVVATGTVRIGGLGRTVAMAGSPAVLYYQPRLTILPFTV
jgi:hypothetical protein